LPVIETDEGYELIYLTKKEDWKNLYDTYASQVTPETAFPNVLSYLREKHKCKAVVVEKDYIDKDYRNEFSVLYSKMLKKYENYCIRLHFFKKKLTLNQLREEGKKDFGYVGYVIVRPTDVAKVGRTVLNPWIHDSNTSYPLCITTSNAHLLGKEFSLKGCPYIQQDTMVMVCAQASIWMAARYMSDYARFDRFEEYLPYEITESASLYLSWLGRTLPCEGLSVHQMVNALSNMGYSPVLYLKLPGQEQGWDPINLIYSYVESQIPVIVTVPDHAITVIGHTFNPNPDIPSGPVVSSHSWLEAFIVHDDNIGPYRLLPVSNDALRNLTINPKLNDLLAPSDWCYRTAIDDIDGVIIPLPEKVYLLGAYVHEITENLIRDKMILVLLNEEAKKGNKTSQEFLDSLDSKLKNPIVLRPYLAKGVEYKKSLSAPFPQSKLDNRIRTEYKNLSMSRYVWIVEITNAERISKDKDEDRTIIGEVVLDATANKHGPSFLAIHLPGILLLRDVNTEKLRLIHIPEDKAYSCFSRKSYCA
jgi:hypothetical protein